MDKMNPKTICDEKNVCSRITFHTILIEDILTKTKKEMVYKNTNCVFCNPVMEKSSSEERDLYYKENKTKD